MGQVRFVQPDGTTDDIEVGAGVSVMLAAVRAGVAGIEGECGGCLDCGTCHVYIDEAQFDVLAPLQDNERTMLATAAAALRPTSRLGCQVTLPPGIETLVVHVPERTP